MTQALQPTTVAKVADPVAKVAKVEEETKEEEEEEEEEMVAKEEKEMNPRCRTLNGLYSVTWSMTTVDSMRYMTHSAIPSAKANARVD